MSRLNQSRIILTGAAGGIGTELAKLLVSYQCKIGLVGRNKSKLDALAEQLRLNGADVLVIVADVTKQTDRQAIIDAMVAHYQGIDMLINNAGMMSFKGLEQESDENIEAIFQTNVIATMQLCRVALPYLRQSQQAHIANIGSTFGTIAFAYYTAYSASKFALRGFSESLRRELMDTDIKVSYIAPRAVKTPLNSSKVFEMAKKINMTMDEPTDIAKKVINALNNGKKDVYFGFPEFIFVRLNMLFPRLVDKALSGQNKIMKQYCDS